MIGYFFLCMFYMLVAAAHYDAFGAIPNRNLPVMRNPHRTIWAILWPIPLAVYLIGYFVLSRRLF